MGWAGGSELLSSVARALAVIPVRQRAEVYREIVVAFAEHDCDTMDECLGEDIALDVAILEDMLNDISEWGRDEDVDDLKAELAKARKKVKAEQQRTRKRREI